MRRRTSLLWLGLSLVGIAALTLVGPAEKSLGTNVRVVYLHGAWVWTALVSFVAAAGTGLLGLVLQNDWLQRWSRALGRTGLIFWITYLPISMWAMQTNWNGLFLAEPRWRLALIFSLGGLALQIGVTLVDNPAWASGANIAFALALFLALRATEEVMHPASPIFSSDAWRIQVYFAALFLLTLLAAGMLARWAYRLESP